MPKESLKAKKLLSSLMEQTFYVSYDPPHKDYWGHDQTVFSVIRSMRDMYNQYGLLILDLDISTLQSLLSDFENPEDYAISILDSDEKLVYSSLQEIDEQIFYQEYQEAASQQKKTFSPNALSLSCFEVSSLTGWTFILSTSTAGYLKSMKELFAISAILFLSLFIIMSGFLYLVTLRLTIPLKKLSSQLKHLKPGKI